MIYLYFDKTGTLKEVINDESIRRGTTNVNGLAVYCELWDDADFTLDDIWYCQRVSCGKLTPEVSFIDNLEIMQVPYKKDVDYTYFKDYKQYKFYVFEFTTEYTQYSGLNVGTVRFAVDDGINALGTITFNIQDNVIKEDNNITQSQYDYLLLSYASRTLNEETGRTLCELIEDIVKEQAKITGIEYVGTTEEILALTSDEGIALSTTNAHIYNWDADLGSYVDSGIEFMDVSLSSNVATLSGNQTFTGNKIFSGGLDVSEVGSNNTSVVNKQYADNINNSAVHKAGTEVITGDKIFIGDIVAMEIKADTHEDLVLSDHFGESKITITEEDGLQLQGYYRDNSDNEYYSSIDLTRGIVDLTSESGIYFFVNHTSIFTATIIANEKTLDSSGTYLKGFLVKTPTNANDIVNKSYADGIKTNLETALGNKADLNNAEQEITAFEITTENMNVADLYQNGANITLDSAFGGISFKPSGSNKYITIGAGQIKGIDTVSNNTDATNKQYVDGIKTNLQSQIDGINAGQNLADIVADLTALNNLSTTNLQVGDKVQVLVDSNHDNGSTVYNWNGTTWVYIGKYGQDGYTKAEADTLLATKQNVIDSSHKLSSDLVDDTNATNKFVSASEKAQITTNQNAITGIKDGTTIDSFADVETALSGKLTALTNTDWAERVYTVATDGTQSVRYISLDSLPNSVVLRNSTGALNCADAVYDSHALNMGFYKATFQPKQHQIIANVNDGVSNFKALITIVSPSTIIDTATLLKTYFTNKGYNFANTTKYAVQNIYISKLNVNEDGFDENSVGMIYDSSTQTFTSPSISNGADLTIVGVVSDTVKAI